MQQWPRPPLTWIQPRLGWIVPGASPQQRTPLKRKLSESDSLDSEQTTEPERMEAAGQNARMEATVRAKLDLSRRVRAGWSPGFIFNVVE